MAECIIARGGGYRTNNNGGGLPPVIVGFCQIVCNVCDSDGVPISDAYVTCNDGGQWYNYHTNENGQVLFVTNSGTANITAFNYSNANRYRYIDQRSANTVRVDAPVTTSKYLDFKLERITNCNFTAETSYMNTTYDSYVFRNSRFRVTNRIGEVIVVGGGGGGGCGFTYGTQNGLNSYASCGGGGGAANHIVNVDVDKNTTYIISVGDGGEGAFKNSLKYYWGSAGGTSSAFGISAIGGRGGDITSSHGGLGYTGNAGGGGNGAKLLNSLNNFVYATESENGFGGGGGAWHKYHDDPFSNRNHGGYNLWYGTNRGGDGAEVSYAAGSAAVNNGNMSLSNGDTGSIGGGGGGGGFAGNLADWSYYPNFSHRSRFSGGSGGNGLVILSNMT